MAEVAPPPIIQTQAPAPAPAPVIARPAPAAPVPPALLNQPTGTQIPVTLLSAQTPATLPATGQFQTPFGNLTLQLSGLPSLPQGTNLLLQVTGQGNQLTLAVLTPDGRPVTGATTAQGAQTSGQTGSQTATAGARAIPQLTPGAATTATFLQPVNGILPSAQTPQAGGLTSALALGKAVAGKAISQLTPGTQTGTSAPQSGAFSGTTPATGTLTQAGTSVATPATASSQGTGQPQLLASGTRVVVRVATITPPTPGITASPTSATAGQNPILAQGQVLSGVVTGAQTGGQTVIDTNLGPISLAIKSPPAAGSRVTLDVTSAPQPPANSSVLRPGGIPSLPVIPFSSGQWPALDDVMRAYDPAVPQPAQLLSQAPVPRADATLTANLLLFLSALRGGDMRGWLGDAISRPVMRTEPNAMARLNDDAGQLSRIAEEPSTGDWRMSTIPFLMGERLEQLRLLTRSHDEDEDEDRKGTRFVVDVTLTELGRIQLDGYVETPKRRLDMVVRSDDHLPSPVRDDIRALYQQAVEITGMKGGIGFQAQPAGFIDAKAKTGADAGNGAGLMV